MSSWMYDDYIIRASAYVKSAELRDANGDFLGAKDAFLEAEEEFENAASQALKDGDIFDNDKALSLAKYARCRAGNMLYKHNRACKEDDKEREN